MRAAGRFFQDDDGIVNDQTPLRHYRAAGRQIQMWCHKQQ
jgi:hypothetical protein